MHMQVFSHWEVCQLEDVKWELWWKARGCVTHRYTASHPQNGGLHTVAGANKIAGHGNGMHPNQEKWLGNVHLQSREQESVKLEVKRPIPNATPFCMHRTAIRWKNVAPPTANPAHPYSPAPRHRKWSAIPTLPPECACIITCTHACAVTGCNKNSHQSKTRGPRCWHTLTYEIVKQPALH